MVNDPNKPFELELPAVSWQLTLIHLRRNASCPFQQGGNIHNALMSRNSFSQLLVRNFPRSFSATSLQEQVYYPGTLVCMFMLYVVGVFADLCCSVHVLPLI